jgi:predicted GH43/DUF377 family glycosyl hydrolase
VYHLHRQERRVSQQEEHSCFTYSAYSSTLKMDAVNICEMVVNIYQTALLNIPEDRPLHRHRPKNLKPHGKIVLAAFNFMQHFRSPHISKYPYVQGLQSMREN